MKNIKKLLCIFLCTSFSVHIVQGNKQREALFDAVKSRDLEAAQRHFNIAHLQAIEEKEFSVYDETISSPLLAHVVQHFPAFGYFCIDNTPKEKRYNLFTNIPLISAISDSRVLAPKNRVVMIKYIIESLPKEHQSVFVSTQITKYFALQHLTPCMDNHITEILRYVFSFAHTEEQIINWLLVEKAGSCTSLEYAIIFYDANFVQAYIDIIPKGQELRVLREKTFNLARRYAREYCVQCLYQLDKTNILRRDLTDNDLLICTKKEEILISMMAKTDGGHFEQTIPFVCQHITSVVPQIEIYKMLQQYYEL
jgi:hypothetical protein